MTYTKIIAKFTIIYIAVLCGISLVDWILLSGGTLTSPQTVTDNLAAFAIAVSLVLRSNSLARSSPEQVRSLPKVLAAWTLFFPLIGLLLIGALDLFAGATPIANGILSRWDQVSATTVLDMMIAQLLYAVLVLIVARATLKRHPHDKSVDSLT